MRVIKRRLITLLMVATSVLSTAFFHALFLNVFSLDTLATAQDNQTSAEVSCGSDIRFSLPLSWVPAAVSFDSVQCAYKGSGSGFPNVNVVVEPAPRNATPLSDDQRIQGILESYRAVGLTDVAVVEGLQFAPTPTKLSYGVVLQYTGERGVMISVVGVLDVGERRFIITFLDVKEAYRLSKSIAQAVLQSVELTAAAVSRMSTESSVSPSLMQEPPPVVGGSASSPAGVIALLVGGALILGAVVLLIKMRQT